MKKLIYLLGLAMLMAVAACSGSAEKKKSDIRVLMQDSTDAHGVQRMTARKSEVDIKYKGKEYHSFISRTPNDSLPRVVSQMGNTYVDNQIVLRLTRGNERVFSRTFTKKQFESLIGDDFMAKSILEGIVYDKTTPEGIVYAASICYPQTDLYVPISITISPDGKISMKKEELLEEVYDEDTSARKKIQKEPFSLFIPKSFPFLSRYLQCEIVPKLIIDTKK